MSRHELGALDVWSVELALYSFASGSNVGFCPVDVAMLEVWWVVVLSGDFEVQLLRVEAGLMYQWDLFILAFALCGKVSRGAKKSGLVEDLTFSMLG